MESLQDYYVYSMPIHTPTFDVTLGICLRLKKGGDEKAPVRIAWRQNVGLRLSKVVAYYKQKGGPHFKRSTLSFCLPRTFQMAYELAVCKQDLLVVAHAANLATDLGHEGDFLHRIGSARTRVHILNFVNLPSAAALMSSSPSFLPFLSTRAARGVPLNSALGCAVKL